jgi:hypothetical protein
MKESNWIGHILRRNCFLKHVIKGQLEGTGRRGERRKQLLNVFKETIANNIMGIESRSTGLHCLESHFRNGYGPVAR